jgi:hypothetical protein
MSVEVITGHLPDLCRVNEFVKFVRTDLERIRSGLSHLIIKKKEKVEDNKRGSNFCCC